ncbi:MAG: alpha/beta fold hydrolase [Pseudomonadota bacterium]
MKFNQLLPRAGALLAAAGWLAGCSSPQLAIDFQPCSVPNIDRVVQCATVPVPVDHEQPGGEALSLFVVRAPATGVRENTPPLMILAGGPGQAAASHYGAFVRSALRQANTNRDIILVDQRGTGRSHPLECDAVTGLGFDVMSDDELADGVGECLDHYEVSPHHFGSEAIVRDLDHVRELLGEDQVALWGASFGTRLALRYVARFPDRVAAMVIDGVTSNTESLFAQAPQHSHAAIMALLARCERTEACDAQQVEQHLSQLIASPAVSVSLRDPLSGAPVTQVIDGTLGRNSVRGALYSPTRTALIPLALSHASEGDLQMLTALAADTASWAGDTMFGGSTLSILCTEDVDRITPDAARQAGAGSLFEDSYYHFWATACRHWPRTDLPGDYGDLVVSDVPTLALSGGLDPVTPPASAEVAIRGLSQVQHLVAPAVGHNVTPEGCAPRLVADFLDAPEAPLDGACLKTLKAPPIIIPEGAAR